MYAQGHFMRCVSFPLEVCHQRTPPVHPHAHGQDLTRFEFRISTQKIASFNAADGS